MRRVGSQYQSIRARHAQKSSPRKVEFRFGASAVAAVGAASAAIRGVAALSAAIRARLRL
jgi:hypothetical protein